MLAVFQGNWLFSVFGFSFPGPSQSIEKDGFPHTTTGAFLGVEWSEVFPSANTRPHGGPEIT